MATDLEHTLLNFICLNLTAHVCQTDAQVRYVQEDSIYQDRLRYGFNRIFL